MLYPVSSFLLHPGPQPDLLATPKSGSVVQIWDSNALQAACTFSLPVQVNTVAMSACEASHCLVAVGAADTEVRLCDPQSGGFSHILLGHKSKVWAVSWSLQSEWELMTGGCDGQVNSSTGCIHADFCAVAMCLCKFVERMSDRSSAILPPNCALEQGMAGAQ